MKPSSAAAPTAVMMMILGEGIGEARRVSEELRGVNADGGVSTVAGSDKFRSDVIDALVHT
jgi:hypothetical protein